MEQQAETDLLQDIAQHINLEPVAPGPRFINFLVDTILYYLVMLLVGIAIGVIYEGTGQDINSSFLVREDAGSISLQYLLSFTTYLVFFTVLEGSSKGKTLGKLITRTRARKLDGGELSWKDAFMRSLCRLVPFEPFSAFGSSPWHDKWTNTIVTKEIK